ncbi:hypothetical protein [Elioraea rosea]|uniref:hypothetical protein n=1 Tax=Elioraea rosea TaxID=2492390 RepID=UPI0011826AB5|nr:hypothetical protein [Elioraea rosea]
MAIDRIEMLEGRRTPSAIVWFRIGDIGLAYTLQNWRRGEVWAGAPERAKWHQGVKLTAEHVAALRALIDARLEGKPHLAKALCRSSAYVPSRIIWAE